MFRRSGTHGTSGLWGSGDLWSLPTARAASPLSEELDPDPLLLADELGNDPIGGTKFLCLSAPGASPALPTTARAATPSSVGLPLVGLAILALRRRPQNY